MWGIIITILFFALKIIWWLFLSWLFVWMLYPIVRFLQFLEKPLTYKEKWELASEKEKNFIVNYLEWESNLINDYLNDYQK